MSLETIYGINASGKDAIANRLKEKDPSIFITTESRLLMYHLGIINSYAAEDPVSKDQYKALENTSQDRIKEITNTTYKKSLESFRESKNTTILLSHLVFLLHIDKEPVFLDQKDPAFPEISNGLVHVKSSPEDILARRIADNESGIRLRSHSSLGLIIKHQTLCDVKWEKITSLRTPGTYITVMNNNGNLEMAVREVQEFINKL